MGRYLVSGKWVTLALDGKSEARTEVVYKCVKAWIARYSRQTYF